MIEALLFDIGGVLVNYSGRTVQEKTVSSLKIEEGIFREAWNQLIPLLGTGELQVEEFWRRFATLTNTQPNPNMVGLFFREYSAEAVLNQDILEIVKSLKSQGYKLGVVSNTIKPHAEFNTQLGLYDYFKTKILSHEVGIRKPNPLIFNLALERIGTAPDKTIFIDDLDENIAVAISLGINGIIYNYPNRLKTDLKTYGVIVP